MLELLENNQKLLELIPEKKIFPGVKNRSLYSKDKHMVKFNQHKESSVDVINISDDVTEDELALHIAKLSQSFINREVGKAALNTSLIELVKKPDVVSLLETLSVADSKHNSNAFDLTLGIKGYLFKFPTLFYKRELFEAVLKNSNKRGIIVYPTNINSIVNKLS